MFRIMVAAAVVVVIAACGGSGPPTSQPLGEVRAPQRTAPARLTSPVRMSAGLEASSLFDWAEYSFPSFFPTGPATAQYEQFTYRGYTTGNYLGVSDGQVWLLGPLSGEQLSQVSSVAAFECLAEPARCASQEVRVANAVNTGMYPLAYAAADHAYQDDYGVCAHSPPVIEFPAHYLGTRTLPRIDGGSLPAAVTRGVVLKDTWLTTNPSYETGCTGSAREAFLVTLQRLKALNAERVSVIPWTAIDNRLPVWRIMNPGELNTSTMTDEDLAWVTQQVHAAGLKIQWVNQIQLAYDSTVPAPTAENIDNFLNAFEAYILERGAYAQQLGIDYMHIGMGANIFPIWVEGVRTQLDERLAQTAVKLRAVYSGKLVYDQLHKDAPATLRAAIDENQLLLHPAWLPLTAQERADISVPLAKQKILDAFQGMTQQVDGTKPTIVGIQFGSRGDLLDTGYLEGTFCTSGYNLVTGSSTECIQRSTPTDFSLQAILHQAAMEAIAQQDSLNVSAVLVEYWLTDRVTPGSTFPNVAVSIRNKPAEAVVRRWFQRP